MSRRQRKPRSKDKPKSQGEPGLSPEVDLLEYLSSGDQPLDQAKLPFPSLEHAQRAVMTFVKAGLADLLVLEGGAETPVPDWQLAAIVNDAGVGYFVIICFFINYDVVIVDSDNRNDG